MIVTFSDIKGFPPNPQAVGQLKLVVKDVLITSEGANDAGDFVVTPARIGLRKILGVTDFLVYAAGAAADYPRSVDFVAATNTVTFYATDRGALDLDAADTSGARLGFWGY